MRLVMLGLIALAIVVFVAFLVMSAAAAEKDRKARAIDAARKDAEDRLVRKGEPLRCLDCGKLFDGPLTDSGCPHCNASGMVIPEVEYVRRTSGQ